MAASSSSAPSISPSSSSSEVAAFLGSSSSSSIEPEVLPTFFVNSSSPIALVRHLRGLSAYQDIKDLDHEHDQNTSSIVPVSQSNTNVPHPGIIETRAFDDIQNQQSEILDSEVNVNTVGGPVKKVPAETLVEVDFADMVICWLHGMYYTMPELLANKRYLAANEKIFKKIDVFSHFKIPAQEWEKKPLTPKILANIIVKKFFITRFPADTQDFVYVHASSQAAHDIHEAFLAETSPLLGTASMVKIYNEKYFVFDRTAYCKHYLTATVFDICRLWNLTHDDFL